MKKIKVLTLVIFIHSALVGDNKYADYNLPFAIKNISGEDLKNNFMLNVVGYKDYCPGIYVGGCSTDQLQVGEDRFSYNLGKLPNASLLEPGKYYSNTLTVGKMQVANYASRPHVDSVTIGNQNIKITGGTHPGREAWMHYVILPGYRVVRIPQIFDAGGLITVDHYVIDAQGHVTRENGLPCDKCKPTSEKASPTIDENGNLSWDSGYIALYQTLMPGAISSGDLNKVNDLLARGINPEARDANGNTGLMLASMQKNPDIVAKFLTLKVDVKAVNNNNDSALMLAARQGSADIVNQLLKAGADVNAVNTQQENALLIAAKNGKSDVVALLTATQNPNLIDKSGNSALYYATGRGDDASVAALLAIPNIDVTMPGSDGRSLLVVASAGSFTKVVQLLVDTKKVKLEDQDQTGRTSLFLATSNNKGDIVDILTKAGADVNTRGPGAKPALIVASEKGYLPIVKSLVAAGADVNATDGLNNTALSVAIDQGKKTGKTIYGDIGQALKDAMNAPKKSQEKKVAAGAQ